MSFIQYAVESPSGTVRRSGVENSSLACKYGGTTKQTISSTTTVTKATGGKLMTGDLQFGSSANIACANKIMPADVVIKTSITSGQKYHIITSSGSWKVPPNVSHIKVFAVGGGCGGANYYRYSSSKLYMGSGGCGGYVNRAEWDVNPGEEFTCVVGAGGAGAGFSDGYSPTKPGSGGETSFTSSSHSLKAAGGIPAPGTSSTKWRISGEGGCGGGTGASYEYYSDGSEYRRGGDGGTNGSDNLYSSGAGYGQISHPGPNGETGNTTCDVDNVAYAGGGGGGGYSDRSDTQNDGRRKPGVGGTYGGGNGGGGRSSSHYTLSTVGTANSGGGGGGGGYRLDGTAPEGCSIGRDGGSGVIVVYWD